MFVIRTVSPYEEQYPSFYPFPDSVMETHYRADMCDQEAYDLARNSVAGAGHRDAMSGGIITGMRVFQVDSYIFSPPPLPNFELFHLVERNNV